MKIICTTSDKYLHLIPVFAFLFNKYWPGQQCEVVGYTKPNNLPDNFTFYSMGKQGHVSEWSNDLRKYFEQQPTWFVWLMEDTFFKEPVNLHGVDMCYLDSQEYPQCGRYDLTGDVQHREFLNVDGVQVLAHPSSRYRLSTQPSIWNRDYLLQYLTPGMTPWEFETQDPKNDGWNILGWIHPPVKHNEGVRRFDPHKLNLTGMIDEDIEMIKLLTNG